MQQEISAEKNTESESITAAKEKDLEIWARQNFVLGCDEMERITDDIIVPVFSDLAKTLKKNGLTVDIILMDCESPLDEQLYNVGVRVDFEYNDKAIEINIVADPSDFTFSLSIDGLDSEIAHELKFHEVVPFTLQKELKNYLEEHFPEVEYTFPIESSDEAFEKYAAPYRVQYDDDGNVSDVATTQTLNEAANMGSTFAKMFKKEDAITVIDASDAVIC